MSHDYHEQLPGFDERQIWHDGCAECEQRGERVAIETLDSDNFRRAWMRAVEWNHRGVQGSLAECERKLLQTLWSVHCQIERNGLPYGGAS